MSRLRRARNSVSKLLLAIVLLSHLQCAVQTADSNGAADLPPVRTEVKYLETKDKRDDDPQEAWEEWGETHNSRKNPFPRRQREIKPGMDINTIMGMAMKQPKVVTAVLTEKHGSSPNIGRMVTTKFRNQMNAAGIGCRLWFVPQGRQVIANCETIRDGHMAKDYMIKQPEIIRTVIDNIPFTPNPKSEDEDDDDDDDDGDGDNDDDDDDDEDGDADERAVSNAESVNQQGPAEGSHRLTNDEL